MPANPAYIAALRMLARRELSEAQVRQRLARKEFELSDGQILHGPPGEEPVVFLESGLRFEADVMRGQKTGFFLDQRENRRLVVLGIVAVVLFALAMAAIVYSVSQGVHK